MSFLNDEGTGLSARQRRTLAKRQTLVRQWLASLPANARRPFYTSAEIAAGTGLDAGQAGPALRAMGWRHAQRRLAERDGLPVSVWAPPDQPHPRRPVGRPHRSANGQEQTK